LIISLSKLPERIRVFDDNLQSMEVHGAALAMDATRQSMINRHFQRRREAGGAEGFWSFRVNTTTIRDEDSHDR